MRWSPLSAHLRKDLWGEHCGLAPGPDRDVFLVLNDALGIWKDAWGVVPGIKLKEGFKRMRIPFNFASPPCRTIPSAPRGAVAYETRCHRRRFELEY